MKADKRGGGLGLLSDSHDESILISKAAKGDNNAFELLMGTHLKVIYNYICLHVSGEEDVKDIVQETMLAVWSGMKSFSGKSAFRTWILGITRRKISDFYRRKYQFSTVSIYEEEASLTADDRFDDSVNAIDVKSAIASLSSEEQELVFLAFNAELTYQEISDIIQVPVGTVKSRMHNIKFKLRKHLEKE